VQSRRQNVRWQTNRPAKVRLGGAEGFVNCILSNISLRGFKITLPEKLPVDQFFKLDLILSEKFSLNNIEVWVAWHKTISDFNSYGIYFKKMKDSDRDSIYKFIRSDFPEQINKQWWEGGETMQDVTFEDKRIFERISVKLPLRFLGGGSGAECAAETCDVSAKGIGLVTKQAPALRTGLELWLDIPDKGEPLYARGEVVWSKPATAGGHRLGVRLEKADLMGMSRVLRAV
jgi:hypothetical protein